MVQHVFSGEQKAVLNHRTEQSPLTVKYLDIQVAVRTLTQLVIQYLAKGKSLNIVVQDDAVLTHINDYLKTLGLSEFLLNEHDFQLSEERLAALRSHFKSKNQLLPQNEAYHTFSFIDRDIKEKYHQLHSHIHSDLDIANLPQILKIKQANNEHGIAVDNIIDVQEGLTISELMEKVEQLSQRFTPEFIYLADSEVIHGACIGRLLTKDDVLITTHKVSTYLSEAIELKHKMNFIRQSYANEYAKNHSEKTLRTKRYLQEAILKIARISNENVDVKKGLFSRKKKTLTDITPFIAEINDTLLSHSSYWQSQLIDNHTSKEQLIQAITDRINLLSEIEIKSKTSFDEVLKHISQLNQQDNVWNEISNTLSSFLTDLNEQQILQTTYENNSKGLYHQLQLVDTVVNTLTKAKIRLEQEENYYLYQATIINDPVCESIVNEFRYIPSRKWQHVFESAYFEHLQRKSTRLNLPHEHDDLDDGLAKHKEQYLEYLDNIKIDLHNKQVNALRHLSASDKALFQSITKKKLPVTIETTQLLTQFAVSKELYPIHISSRENDRIYDVTISISETDIPQASMFHFTPFTKDDFENVETKNYAPLYLNHYQYTEKLIDLSNTDKIKAAKKLAKQLLAINQNIKLYQLKSANVISLLPHQDDAILEELLLENGAKSMHLDDIYLQLVESVLETGRSQYLIIKDGLLHNDNTDNYLWQQFVIENYKKAGIDVRSIFTKDQLVHSIVFPIEILTKEIVSDAIVDTPEIAAVES